MERFGRPNVVAVEGDVLPAEWSDMSEQIVTDPFAIGAQFGYGVAEIDSVPEDDSCDDEIKTGSTVALIFEGPVADFTEAVKEHCPGERVTRLSLVEAGVRPAPQSWVADPVEGEKGAFEPAYFPKGLRQRVLFGVSREPTHQDRRRNGSSFD